MVVSYRLSIVTVALSVTIRPQFAIECLRRSNQLGVGDFWPKFRGVPLGAYPSCWGCKERTSQANWWWNYFGRIPTYVITIHQRYRRTDRRTDGRTDGQTTCDRNTALCTEVHRAVNTTVWSCQPLRYFRHLVSRKQLEIDAWFQRTTNRKWPMGNPIITWVTWPLTSR